MRNIFHIFKKLLLLGVLLFLIGCDHKQETRQTFQNHVQCNNIVSEINFEDFIDEYKMIKLETNEACLLGDIEKLVVHHGNFYILSKYLYCFNKKGEFVFKISDQGKGPAEFIQIQDFSIEGDTIYLYDNWGSKINRYNSSTGQYLDKTNVIHSSVEMEINGKYLYYNRVSRPNKLVSNSNMLISHKINEPKKIASHFPLKQYRSKRQNQLMKTNDKIIWLAPTTCNVFSMHKQDTIKYTEFDFGKMNVSREDITSGRIKNSNQLAESGKAWGLNNYVENNQFMTASLILGNAFSRIVVDKVNHSSIVIKNSVVLNARHFKHYTHLGSIRAADESYFYAIQPAYDIESMKKKHKESGQKIPQAYKNVKKAIFNTKSSDNPVILVYKFKEIPQVH